MAFITTMVLCAKFQDSFVSVRAWGVFHVSYSYSADISILTVWILRVEESRFKRHLKMLFCGKAFGDALQLEEESQISVHK